jgi:hypothetical protein
MLRRGALSRAKLAEEALIPETLLPLVKGLHDLFYQPVDDIANRIYRRDVTAKEVQAVCQNVCTEIKPLQHLLA